MIENAALDPPEPPCQVPDDTAPDSPDPVRQVLGTAPPASRRLHTARTPIPPRADEREGFRRVLARGDFRLLWGAQAASQLADKFLMFTMLIVVYDLSHAAVLQSVLMIAYTLPSVFLSAPAGVYADRHDKRALMIWTNVVRGALVLLVPIAEVVPLPGGRAWLLILITLLFSSAGQVFAPAEAASIPSLVSRDQIMGATSLFMTTVILTLVLGVPAATVAIRLVGITAPFYIATALFAVAALAIWRIRMPLRSARSGPPQAASLRRELSEGFTVLRSSPPLRLGLYQLGLALVVVFTVFALGPVYLVRVLHRSDQDTYLVLIPATLGLVGTATVLGQRATSRLSRAGTLVTALFVSGMSLVAVGVAPHLLETAGLGSLLLPMVVLSSGIFGCALGGLLIPAFSVLQEKTDEESRGRIFGGIFAVINAAVAVPLLVAGIISDLVGVAAVVAGLGALILVAALLSRTLLWHRLTVLDRPSG